MPQDIRPSHRKTKHFPFLPSFLRKSRTNIHRRFARHVCALKAEVEIIEAGFVLDGLILEISQGGCAFRPASLFLLERDETEVMVRCPQFQSQGLIRNLRDHRYGIEFDTLLDEETLNIIGNVQGTYGQ
jgi:hypothetical protein